ncbi:tripartite tricarboxylate transporter substrate-binding protein [Cupriavidus basilensis]|uniref:Tripartite tricarboxylate transporter substrate-binding protein n=1 Tax=Cupriavidus basilensis TaxID=68895 RepID=A0ABT6AVP3_9BURK|nr:tripartite tricarboxylate transporter substrate-binding protein [Cupriavidus basilensis]MDF3836692.1 tripartite tricarboxylate transporter substrate-binding protein [Cupriavidus basilensis]
MRTFLKRAFVSVSIATFALAGTAAEEYPTKPIRIVVPSAPGGLADIAVRVVAQKMSERLGQPVTVENKPGADTLLGTRYVKAAPADGYTLLSASNTISIQAAIKLDAGYELKDFVGIGPYIRSPYVMLVGAAQPDKSAKDFIARGTSNPKSLSFASGGVGTSPYMAEQMFLQRAGLNLMHVPYKGIAAAMPDVISGRVTMIFDAVGSSAGHMRAGRLRALGMTSTNRLSAFPDVPTIAEQGMPGFSSYVTIGLLAPAATPKFIVKKLAAALQGAIASREVRERFEPDGAEFVPVSPEEYMESLKREQAEFAKLAEELGISKQ